MEACCPKLGNFPLTLVNLFDGFHTIMQIISRDLRYHKHLFVQCLLCKIAQRWKANPSCGCYLEVS